MQYCVDHPEEISKLAKVKAQVSEVKGVMMEKVWNSKLVISTIDVEWFTIVQDTTTVRTTNDVESTTFYIDYYDNRCRMV